MIGRNRFTVLFLLYICPGRGAGFSRPALPEPPSAGLSRLTPPADRHAALRDQLSSKMGRRVGPGLSQALFYMYIFRKCTEKCIEMI